MEAGNRSGTPQHRQLSEIRQDLSSSPDTDAGEFRLLLLLFEQLPSFTLAAKDRSDVRLPDLGNLFLVWATECDSNSFDTDASLLSFFALSLSNKETISYFTLPISRSIRERYLVNFTNALKNMYFSA